MTVTAACMAYPRVRADRRKHTRIMVSRRLIRVAIMGGMSTDEAAGLLATAPSAGELAGFLAGARADERKVIYRHLVRHRRPAVSDELIGMIRRLHGDGEAARLLPACSAAQVARLLPVLACGVRDWRPIAITHPAVMLDDAGARLTAPGGPADPAWQDSYWGGVLAAAGDHPGRVLGLLERHAPPERLPGPARRYAVLARFDHGRRWHC